jgi:uncharacterized protein (TIGR00369 family)
MTRLNPAHLQQVMDIINQAPFFRLLSMTVLELEAGRATLDLAVAEKHHNPFHGVHGGVFCSVIDTAAYWAVYGELDEPAGMVTLDVTVHHLAPILGRRLLVTGRSLKVGQSICLAEASARTEDGRLVGQGTSKLMVRGNGQSILELLNEQAAQPLPPKFLD